MADRVILRDYQPTDREACLAIVRENIPKTFSESDIPEFLQFLEDLPCPFYVLEAPDGVFGMGGQFIRRDATSAGLAYGVLAPAWQGRGWGEFLLLFRLARLAEVESIERVLLDTSQHTAGFFERWGFRTTAIEKDHYAPGLDRHDMELRLDAAARASIRERLSTHPHSPSVLRP